MLRRGLALGHPGAGPAGWRNMKQLRDIVVKKGTKDRLQVTLRTGSETMTVWMDGGQAEQLVVAILATRFDIEGRLIIDAPKRKPKRSPVFLIFRTFSPLGERPEYSAHTLNWAEVNGYPDIRNQLKQAQDRWDKRNQRRQSKMPPARERGFLD